MSGKNLSQQLLELNFIPVLGTSEHPKMKAQALHVRRGTPNTWDSANGVTVVYDEKGNPWIMETEARLRILLFVELIVNAYKLEKGAYVPHSTDSGWFIKEVIPTL